MPDEQRIMHLRSGRRVVNECGKNGNPTHVMPPQPHCRSVSARAETRPAGRVDTLIGWFAPNGVPATENGSTILRLTTTDIRETLILDSPCSRWAWQPFPGTIRPLNISL